VERHADAGIFPQGAPVICVKEQDSQRQTQCHPVETSMLEGALSRAIVVWPTQLNSLTSAVRGWKVGRNGWTLRCGGRRWTDCGLDRDAMIHAPYNIGDRLPWDHINVKKGRTFLEKRATRALTQLAAMADAV